MWRDKTMYEATLTEEEVAQYPSPHEALKYLREQIVNQILNDYALTATNEGKSLKYTAVHK